MDAETRTQHCALGTPNDNRRIDRRSEGDRRLCFPETRAVIRFSRSPPQV